MLLDRQGIGGKWREERKGGGRGENRQHLPSGMSQKAGQTPRAARVGMETLASNRPDGVIDVMRQRQAECCESAVKAQLPSYCANLREVSTQPEVKLKICRGQTGRLEQQDAKVHA